jgi:lysyl-tRNA synthetase, class I
MAMHWSEKIARRVTEEFPRERCYTCASGISPSGVVHAGNFRDLITSEAVFRSLENLGMNARLLLSLDDFDRLRKVPQGIPESFSKYLGMPLSDIPDPFGEFQSYALRYEVEFENSIKKLGIKPHIVKQSEKYRAGDYDDMIRLCLTRRIEIASIMARFKSQGMSEEDINRYFPITLYSRFTGKDNTEILSFDGDSRVTYRCRDTSKEDAIDFTKDRRIKLVWKIDWPMRWSKEGVNFEPGGRDHASAGGGSYEVSQVISRDIFQKNPPIFQGYEFVGIRGIDEKMSSSKGKVVTINDLLGIYEPAMVRWLYLRTNPEQEFKFAFDQEVFRMYHEFDEFARLLLSSADPEHKYLSNLVTAGETFPLLANPVPFRQIAGYGQIADFESGKLEEILARDRETYDPRSVESRLDKSRVWLEKYNPGTITRLRSSKDLEYVQGLTEEQKLQIRNLTYFLKENFDPTIEVLEKVLYGIPKSDGLGDSDNKKRQRDFFKILYGLLFGTETGPRLPVFLWATKRNKILDLIDLGEN